MSPYYRELRSKVGKQLLLVPSVAAVIRDRGHRILLQEKRNGEGWSLPAGAIEPGESPEEAICREVLEETGYTVDPTKILGVFGGEHFRYMYPNGDQVEYVVVLYLCTIVSRQDAPGDPETQSIRYVGIDEAPALALPYPQELLFGRTKE